MGLYCPVSIRTARVTTKTGWVPVKETQPFRIRIPETIRRGRYVGDVGVGVDAIGAQIKFSFHLLGHG